MIDLLALVDGQRTCATVGSTSILIGAAPLPLFAAAPTMSNLSIEQELKRYLTGERIRFVDNTASYQQPDFALWWQDGSAFFLEVKEKRQSYNSRNWPAFAPEPDLFILDDLTVRKCLAYSPRAGVLVRDNLRRQYHFFSVIDLALMPRCRVNRSINRTTPDQKGKWLINLQNGLAAPTLPAALDHVRRYVAALPEILFAHHPCYGDYVGEEIGSGGIPRSAGYWDADVQQTR
jgi:hypothetical protein